MKKILALSCCCVDMFPEKNIINAGGNALNLAASVARTGKSKPFLMGNIGTDLYAKKIKGKADFYGIDSRRLYEVDGHSANNKIYLTESGDRYFKKDSWTEGVYKGFRISDDDEMFMKSFDAVATTFNDPDFDRLLKISLESNFLLSVDFMDHSLKDEWQNYLPAIDLFFISGKEDYFHLLKKWSKEHNTLFVVTLAESGSIAYKNGREYFCEAVSVENVVDTTGCGDSYQGAFIVDYLMNGDVLSSMKAGSESAAHTLSFAGAC